MRGFRFHETMTGTWRPSGNGGERGDGAGPERTLRFTVDVTAADLVRYLRDRRARIEGTVEAEGLARHAAVEGEMHLDPILGRVIGYDFRFCGDDGRAYAFRGQKDIRLRHLVRSLTTLPGAILDGDGRVVGGALLRFDLWDLPSFVASFVASLRAPLPSSLRPAA